MIGNRVRWTVEVAFMLVVSLPAYGARLVYLGQDPTCHYTSHVQATDLARNAVQWAGQGTDPAVAIITNVPCDPVGLMAAAGFSSVTNIVSADLATTDLSGIRVLYVGAFINGGTVPGFGLAVQRFVNGGGGLVVEGSQGDWGVYPFGLQAGPASNFTSDELVTIVNAAHPVMAGLSDAGLSNWGNSIHQDFATPGAAGFTTLTIDDSSTAVDIVREVFPGALAPAMGWPGMAALVLLLLVSGFYSVRRAAR